MKKITAQNGAPAVGFYSHGIVSNGLLFTAGQIHLLADGTLLDGTITDKTHQVMKNIQAILEAAETSFAQVIKATIYVTNLDDYAEINDVYEQYIGDPAPARELVCVAALPLGASIEMSVVAEITDRSV